MYRRHKERRRYSRRGQDRSRGSIFTSAFRTPGTQILVLLIVALVVYLSLQFGGGNSNLPGTIGASEAYNLYQSGAFVLCVRTVQEWNEYHVPNTTLMPPGRAAARPADCRGLPIGQPQPGETGYSAKSRLCLFTVGITFQLFRPINAS